MVRLFEVACRQALSVLPDRREAWLSKRNQPGAAALLRPVLAQFAGQAVADMDAALAWCREHIISRVGVG